MKDMLKRYINIMDKGLFLLDAPTGFGKTTAVIDYITEYLNEDINTIKRIFFITNLKKNLPIDALSDKIGIEKFNDSCLFLKPYWETIIEKWKCVSIKNTDILKSEEYLNLNVDINNIRKIKDSITEENKFEYNSLIKSFESKIEKDTEPKFRELVKKTLFINKLSGEKKKNLKDNEWLDELYPTTNIEKYKVIFASTNKFFSPLDCFYKVPFHIYNDLLINDSIVFIDEFDDTKKVLLDSIIDDGLKISVDIIKLFLNIYFALQHIKIPKVLHKLSKENQEKHEKYPNLKKAEQILNINKEKFEEIYNKHKLDFLIKTKNVKEDKAFLFSDGNYLTITKNSTKKHLITELDEKESNQILIEAVEKKYERNLLSIMIEDIEKTLNHFIVGATWIAQNYKDYKNSIKTKESNYYTIEESIRSILSVFNIGEEYYEYLTEMVSIENSEGKLYPSDSDEDNLFIKHGLSVLEVEDSDYHDMQSTVHLFKFNITPEELLIRICKKSKVIGISATATLDTVLGNFDLKHLKKSLKDKFYEIENEDIKKLEVAFGEQQEIYKNREISLTAKVIDDFPILNDIDKCKELINEMFSDEQLKNKYTNYITIAEKIYYFLIVLKIAYCYYNFIKSSTMKSFICFINSFPTKKINNNLFDKLYRDDLEEILNDISSDCITYILKSSDFVLADLGLSSMQIDNPERGFTFKQDGPLDLRLNQSEGISGAQLLEQLSQKELESLLIDNSDEPYAKKIASTITSYKRRGLKITTTKQLASIVEKALEGVNKDEEKDFLKKSCQRVFQALRIDVNKELDSLAQMLESLPSLLKSGGRVAILSFHSGEDRLVKKSFKHGCKEGIYLEVARDIIRPSLEECSNNPRAHSAKLRWAIKA